MCTHFSNKNPGRLRRFYLAAGLVLLALGLALPAAYAAECNGTVDATYTADVVLFDTPMFFNRLGAHNPNWMMYALKRDVIAVNPDTRVPTGDPPGTSLVNGAVALRPDKRPRPLVLRVPECSKLQITFTNLLADNANPLPELPPDNIDNDNQVAGRYAGVHIAGMQLVGSMADDGSNVGDQGVVGAVSPKNGLVKPGGTITYTVYAEREGAFLITSHGAAFGGEATGGNVGVGAFAMVGVQPRGAKIYRSQVTEEEFRLADAANGLLLDGIPDYEALYPEFLVEPVNEVQMVSITATGGTFTLTFGANTTAAIAFDADVAAVQTELEALESIGVGNVIVGGASPNLTVEFTGALGNQDVALLGADGTLLTDTTPAINVNESTPGFAGTTDVWFAEGKANLPVLNMICNAAAVAAGACAANEIVHSEINAIVAYKNPTTGAFENFPRDTYPLESTGTTGLQNPSVPNRLEAFRDFASIWHDENAAVQAFPNFFNDPVLSHALHGVRDSFMINYGSGGIGSEIIANRLGLGPMYDCLGCAYEEFFLTSFTVGDPAMLVDAPANTVVTGPIATEALYPEDPANVHHSYVGDKAKFRNVHAGPKEQHIFHLHNHQWLFNANDDNANYLDAQGIGPGSSYTFEINYGGSGNRNKTAGDAIFHCHFYPHFAQGMWYLWRIHDVRETGTVLEVTGAADVLNPVEFHTEPFALQGGKPAAGARATPDGEIIAGTPIPAVVPIPGKNLPPVPATVRVVAKDANGDGLADSSQADVDRTEALGADGIPGTDDDMNPGYPFWIAGIECGDDVDDLPGAGPDGILGGEGADDDVLGALSSCESGIVGQRPPTPQLDMLPNDDGLGELDEGSAEWLLANDPFYRDQMPLIIAAEGGDVDKWRASFTAGAGGFDGGLPRHSIDGCKAAAKELNDANVPSCLDPGSGLNPGLIGVVEQAQTRLDFHKEVLVAKGVIFPEEGTDLEKVAMGFHAVRSDANGFVLNGGPPVPGAPYNEPCIDDAGSVFYSDTNGQFFNSTIGGIGGGNFQGSPAADRSADDPFTYKAANIQIDAVFNKVGYHYPQQRIIALWGDIVDTINKDKAPEPFVMRLNTFDCAKYLHSNLVPKEFEVDDYQVRTPTDIIGQHIHLPKWDLTTTDGAANGWNYEDGTLSPGMVRERIDAINAFNGDTALIPLNHPDPVLAAESIANGNEWLGARVTTQRWFIDPVFNTAGVDRGIGIVFSHDHYGPSTFQQVGLYSTLLVEPAGSTWKHNETGVALGTRDDGGPVSWQAVIEPGTGGASFEAFREFFFQYGDFQHAYEAGIYVGAGPDGRPFTGAAGSPSHNGLGINTTFPVTANSFRHAINPSYREEAVDNGPLAGAPEALPDILRYPGVCPDGINLRPCPEAISADDPGILVVNYRNEPVGLRVFDPNAIGPDDKPGTQTVDDPTTLDVNEALGGDLAFALATPPLLGPDANTPIAGQPAANVFRAIAQMNAQPVQGAAGALQVGVAPLLDGNAFPDACPGCTKAPTVFPPPLNDPDALIEGDPYTPMMRAFPGDLVRMKVQVGATEHEHSVTAHGVKWLQGGSGHGAAPNSGWRNAQNEGISEQLTFAMPVNSDPQAKQPFQFDERRGADHMYAMDAGQDGYWSGMWGILRSYSGGVPAGAPLVQLPEGFNRAPAIANRRDFAGVCPAEEGGPAGQNEPANLVSYDVIAMTANELLGNQLGATIVPADESANMHVGVQPTGPGTLVYNPRGGDDANPNAEFQGPLHDPTALLFVRADDLEPLNGFRPNGQPVDRECRDNNARPGVANPPCQVKLKDGAPLEPLILRANAGDCVEVRLFNRLTDQVPDLAGYNTLLQVVNRDRQAPGQAGEPDSVTTFQNNLIRPSSYVGLHAQLVEYDITQHDGTVVGGNIAGGAVVGPTDGITLAPAPFNAVTYRWYAGDITAVRVGNRVRLDATPVEFGGSNLIPADKVKQGQKAMIGALVIEPQGSSWPDVVPDPGIPTVADLTDTERDRQQGDPNVTRFTRADVTVTGGPNGDFDDHVVVVQKGLNLRYKDSTPVENIAGEGGLIPEDSHDAGQKGINYGTEPAWYRFGVTASTPFGTLSTEPNPEELYANALTAGNGAVAEDPATPVYEVTAGQEARMRVLSPTGVGRGSTFTVHGHIWQRDPYLEDAVPSQTIGDNPLGMWLGGQESVTPGQHFDIRLEEAGGKTPVAGDYLYRDQASFGNTDGLWGLLRVLPLPSAEAAASGGGSRSKKK